ncbi:MAG: preprotein translocase subunit YajC [Rhodococcus sp.]|nr:preprotein translocase subunit YajC [Rhodococcus sp. (in: high G+C Gram-positive bacteria)]
MDFLFPLLILALLVPMFLGMRRQKKAMAEAAALQDSLQVGDRILTTAGLHGTVAGLTDTTMDLEIAPGVVTTWSRAVVREHLVDEDSEEQDDSDTAAGTVIEENASSAVEYGSDAGNSRSAK